MQNPQFTKLVAVVACLFTLAACGYRLAGAKSNAGRGQSLAIPIFANRTTTYKLEQHVTEAVRREFIRRTQFRVLSEHEGDVALSGEVLSFIAIPIIFNEQGRGSTYSIAVEIKVQAVDNRTRQVIFQHDRWTFRELFELAQTSEDFVLEDSAAIDRLARKFASTLVASMLSNQQ